MAEYTEEEKAVIDRANALMPLLKDRRLNEAFVGMLQEMARQERDEIAATMDAIGRCEDGGEGVFSLNEGLARRLEFARIRQRVFEEEIVSFIVSIVSDAARITERQDLVPDIPS